jgi:hypothetical protein
MQTLSDILKVQAFEAQYGRSERCFSPDKRGEAPPTAVVNDGRAQTEKTIRLCLEYRTLPSGDVVLVPTYGDEDTKNDAGQKEGS